MQAQLLGCESGPSPLVGRICMGSTTKCTVAPRRSSHIPQSQVHHNLPSVSPQPRLVCHRICILHMNPQAHLSQRDQSLIPDPCWSLHTQEPCAAGPAPAVLLMCRAFLQHLQRHDLRPLRGHSAVPGVRRRATQEQATTVTAGSVDH